MTAGPDARPCTSATRNLGSVPQRPLIVDATLREGAQTPGVRFDVAQSVEIALAAVDLRVDVIECGHPSMMPKELRRVREVVAAAGETPVLAHARARESDIEAVARSGAAFVGIFLRILDPTLDGDSERLIVSSIEYAKQIGLGVRFTIEDGARTNTNRLLAAYDLAVECGADRICLADTVGGMKPWEVEDEVTRLRSAFNATPLEVHLHNDRGLADANALVAVRAGAEWVSSTVNGIGERCGVTDTITLLVNLADLGLRDLPAGATLQHASRVVAAHSRVPVSRDRPIVGRNAFTHTAKLHRRAVAFDEMTYSWQHPATFARSTSLDPDTLPAHRRSLMNPADIISATELRYHRHGPGERYVMVDDRFVEDARQYCILRHVPMLADYGAGHVDTHRHTVDSLFLFIGKEVGMTGLTAEVALAEERFVVESPASVVIPAGIEHSYRVIDGTGYYVNHVLAGTYEESLLDRTPAAAAHAFLQQFLLERCPDVVPERGAAISTVFDSLLLLDFYVNLEERVGPAITLDDVAECKTFGDLIDHLTTSWPD